MLDSLKGLGNPVELMGKLREMQEEMNRFQQELGRKTVTADAGGGMVLATVNGRLELTGLKIDKAKIDMADIELLEDVIVAAVHAAQTKAQEMTKQEMQRMAQGMGIPPSMLGQ